MALTREQFQKLREKNLSVEQIIAFERGNTPTDLQRGVKTAQLTAGQQFERKPTTFLGKARDFTTGLIGGGKLAEGAGMAIAAPGIRTTIETEQRQTEELQNKILIRIREKRELGENTSRLEKALKDSQGLSVTLQDVQKDFEEALPTTKEVIGSSLRLATTLGAGLITRTAAKGLALGKAVGFGAGALRGAAVGAISGATVGGLAGTGLGLEANKSSIEILQSGLLGAGTGAVVGGALGAVTGGISGALKQRAITKENFAKTLVAPKDTTKVKTAAIRGGRLEDPGWLKKAELQFSKRDELVSKSIDDVVKPKATLGQNIDAIRLKISQTNS